MLEVTKPALLIYVSTSGSTGMLAASLAEHFPKLEVVNATALRHPASVEGRRLVILATPTYGKGDAHSTWMERGRELLEELRPGQTVALLGLGDARGHPSTFAGGIGRLRDIIAPLQPALTGFVSAGSYQFESSAAVTDGMFPGLVVEYRRRRHIETQRSIAWLERLFAERGIEPLEHGPRSGVRPYGHFTTGGMEDRMLSTLPPVLRPKIVPRS